MLHRLIKRKFVWLALCSFFLCNLAVHGISAGQECISPTWMTIFGDVLYSADWGFQWDREKSSTEFPDGIKSVAVFVKGGHEPYVWEVNEGFQLNCTHDECGTANTVTLTGDACVAHITVTDAHGKTAVGEVRSLNGRWDSSECYRYKQSMCYTGRPCSGSPQELDFGGYLVQYSCCYHGGPKVLTGECDGFSFTATTAGCELPDGCEDSGLFSLYIYKWTCN